MKITYFGQNSLQIDVEDTTILVDPFISGNPLSKDKIDINSLKADYILLTHAHQDHVLDAEAIAKNTGATIVSNWEIASHYEAKGITGKFVAAPYDGWDSWPKHLEELQGTDIFTLRRIVPRDRGMDWQ